MYDWSTATRLFVLVSTLVVSTEACFRGDIRNGYKFDKGQCQCERGAVWAGLNIHQFLASGLCPVVHHVLLTHFCTTTAHDIRYAYVNGNGNVNGNVNDNVNVNVNEKVNVDDYVYGNGNGKNNVNGNVNVNVNGNDKVYGHDYVNGNGNGNGLVYGNNNGNVNVNVEFSGNVTGNANDGKRNGKANGNVTVKFSGNGNGNANGDEASGNGKVYGNGNGNSLRKRMCQLVQASEHWLVSQQLATDVHYMAVQCCNCSCNTYAAYLFCLRRYPAEVARQVGVHAPRPRRPPPKACGKPRARERERERVCEGVRKRPAKVACRRRRLAADLLTEQAIERLDRLRLTRRSAD